MECTVACIWDRNRNKMARLVGLKPQNNRKIKREKKGRGD